MDTEKLKELLAAADPLFWQKVRFSKESECWGWAGCTNRYGYGQLFRAGRVITAHRHAYALAFGKIAIGAHVCHTCDNRACVHPGHMFTGTNAENTADRDRKGRAAKGERHGRAKLTEAQVRDIRAEVGMTNAAIARKYGLGQTSVRKIRIGESWASTGATP